MKEYQQQETWSENVILVDADHIDQVAFNLIVNFERMLERRIPQADLARWIDCIALDGGLMPNNEEQSTQVILLHSKDHFENFVPSNFNDELDGKAFRDNLGEFCISSVRLEKITTMEDLFIQSMTHLLQQPNIKNLLLISNDVYVDQVLMNLRQTKVEQGKHVHIFTMEPVVNGTYSQQLLGFSVMAALGIKGEELERMKRP